VSEVSQEAAGLAGRVRAGETRALAQAISLVEDRASEARDLIRLLYPATGSAHVIGLTGPPGAGKSTLISALVAQARGHELSVGVISVDPSSPLTSGALLGDRIRLSEHFDDPGVFIRSMATRGYAGGLSETALEAVLVLDAAGKDVVFVETVGTGQNEIGVLAVADTVVVAVVPGTGDAVQALKAGIMEIPDLIAVTRIDHPLASATRNDLRSALSLGGDPPPPIVLTEAVRGEGVDELWAAIVRHKRAGEVDGRLDDRRRSNREAAVMAVVSARARRYLENAAGDDPNLRVLLDRVRDRTLDPLTAVHEILREVFHVDDQDDSDPR
jgi:GTPase